jgi:hypothetical protein
MFINKLPNAIVIGSQITLFLNGEKFAQNFLEDRMNAL